MARQNRFREGWGRELGKQWEAREAEVASVTGSNRKQREAMGSNGRGRGRKGHRTIWEAWRIIVILSIEGGGGGSLDSNGQQWEAEVARVTKKQQQAAGSAEVARGAGPPKKPEAPDYLRG